MRRIPPWRIPPGQFPPIKLPPGEFPPVNPPTVGVRVRVGVGIHQGGINRGELTRGNSPWGNLIGGNWPGGNSPVGNFPRILYNNQIIKKQSKTYFSTLLQLFFLYDKFRLEKDLLVAGIWKVLVAMKNHHNYETTRVSCTVFQYKTLNNVLYLNKMFFRFWVS